MRLRKIPIDFLWEGLELSGDIYNDRGSVLLLKRGEVLTQDRLDKLSKFERGGYITTSEETYQEILNSGKAPRAALQRVYEEAVGYTALKNDVDSIFSVTRNASLCDTVKEIPVMGYCNDDSIIIIKIIL